MNSKGIEIVTNPYNNPESNNYLGVFVTGVWSDSFVDFITQHKVQALYLNSAKGWRGGDYSFLQELPMIKELQILTGEQAVNLTAIECMPNLTDLSVTCLTNEVVDFTKLPNLKTSFLLRCTGASSILWCHQLEALHIDKLKVRDYSLLGSMSSLRFLAVNNSPINSVDWIEGLHALNKLWLINCKKIEDLAPIAKCSEIEWLRINGYGDIEDLSFLSQLKKLKILDLSDCGELGNLSVMSYLKSLKAFAFAGRKTKVTDGDLSILETLPKLAMLMFQPRKNYTHRLVKRWSWDNIDIPDALLERVK